jgi:hypothetical protein
VTGVAPQRAWRASGARLGCGSDWFRNLNLEGLNTLDSSIVLNEWTENLSTNETQFINVAANMSKQSDGEYAVSLPTDNPDNVHEVLIGGRGPGARVAAQADSLRRLNYWADYLFGPNQVGQEPLSGTREPPVGVESVACHRDSCEHKLVRTTARTVDPAK